MLFKGIQFKFLRLMKPLHTLFGTAIATIAICMIALIISACNRIETIEDIMPIASPIPTTLVYSINPSGPFDRAAIQYSPSAKPETFEIKGHETSIDLEQAFSEDDWSIEAMPMSESINIGLDESLHSTEISVLNAVTCKSVSRNIAKDTSTSFMIEDGRVWLLSKIGLPTGKYGWVNHVWKFEGKEMGRSEFLVEGPQYRCSSYKTLCENCQGTWSVEIQTENGEVLESLDFEVLKANL